MEQNFFSRLPHDTHVLVCIHSVASPEEMILVYHSADGQLSCACEREHDMETATDWRMAHASHIAAQFPQVQHLLDVPPDHVAMYFPDYEGKWVVESLLYETKESE